MNLFQMPMQNGTFVSGHMLEGTLGLRLQKINLWIVILGKYIRKSLFSLKSLL